MGGQAMSNARKLELQRLRRAQPGVKEAENAKERERYAALPKDHPRKNRSDRHTEESKRRKAEKDRVELPDHVVARRYLHLRVKDCPTELIGLKREVMKLNRMLGIQVHTI
jgi:hypothetical protein